MFNLDAWERWVKTSAYTPGEPIEAYGVAFTFTRYGVLGWVIGTDASGYETQLYYLDVTRRAN